MYSNNVFLSEEESPQDAIVASLIALNLEPDQNVVTDSQGKLVSGGSGGADTLQDVYDASTTQPQILTDGVNLGLEIREGDDDDNNTLTVQNIAGTDTFTVEGNGTCTSEQIITDNLIMEGGVNGTIQMDVYTPAEMNTLNSNLGVIEDKVVLAYNNDSRKIDLIKSGIIYRGQQDLLVCPEYDMRFSQTLTSGVTYFQKFYSPITTLISHIRLFNITQGAGPIKIAIYDVGVNFIIANTNTQPSWANGTFVNLPLASSTRLEQGRNYWIAITQNNLVSTNWQLGHTTTNASGGTGGGEVGYATPEISYYVIADYTAGFPNNIPPGIVYRPRIWFQLYGSFND